jgi:protein arginine kinase activator
MLCQNCHKNSATVHVTEIVPAVAVESEGAPAAAPWGAGPAPTQVHEQHLCELCAQSMKLPEHASSKKSMADIWKLLQLSALQNRKQRRQNTLACKPCGMTLEDFRRKGRLGCPECYRTFGEQVEELLERVHGARRHLGRIPGVSNEDVERMQRLAELRQRLDVAVREEDYEGAAGLRDQIRRLEAPSQ